MAVPVTRYAKSGDVHIAYQVFGSGPIDLVFVPGFVSHIENYWDHPDLARWLLRLSSFARVAIFDKRGTGLSDRVSEAPSLDQRMDDVRAVMDRHFCPFLLDYPRGTGSFPRLYRESLGERAQSADVGAVAP